MKKRLFIGIMLQIGFMLLSCYASDHFTERFTESRPFNLDGMSLTFTPDGSEDFYSATAGSITALPVDSTFHNTLGLGDDDYINVLLSGVAVKLYGVSYTSINIGSNGFLTFDSVDSSYGSDISTHFDQPRVSTFFADENILDGGRISWRQLADRVVVTFSQVRIFSGAAGTGAQCTFQCEMFFDGQIRMSWLGINYSYPLVGLSKGEDVPVGFTETDLNAFRWDYDGDGLPNAWETLYFGSNTNANPDIDSDGDGFSNREEYITGMHPLDDSSFFQFTAEGVQESAGVVTYVVQWDSIEGRDYSIWTRTNLVVGDFELFASGMGYPANAYTATVDQAQNFYKLGVQLVE